MKVEENIVEEIVMNQRIRLEKELSALRDTKSKRGKAAVTSRCSKKDILAS